MSPESSIATHLQADRTFPVRQPLGFNPSYPSYTARFGHEVEHVVMAFFGVQFCSPTPPLAAARALNELLEASQMPSGPAQLERARYIDEVGFTCEIAIMYWTDLPNWLRWRESAPSWTAHSRVMPEVGFFSEVVVPSTDRFETLLSSRSHPVGVAATAQDISGEILEHGYWGGMRDRIPRSQHDLLAPVGELQVKSDGNRVRVFGHHNLCLIRSGQDWSDTEGDERDLYLKDVHPVLKSAMTFLTEQGASIGCYANRFMRVLDSHGRETDQTFGMSWWRSLADLELWSASHPTHKEIFGSAMRYLAETGADARLRLFHEVVVGEAGSLEFDYSGCHRLTGLLRAVVRDSP